MPFDGQTLARADGSLAASRRRAFVPVPSEVLESHKAQQIAMHPASLLLRHPILLALAGLTWTIGAVFGITTMLFSLTVIARERALGSVFACLTVAVLSLAVLVATHHVLFGRMRGPARWVHHNLSGLYGDHDIPDAILTVARTLARQDPFARFVVGTLVQDKVELDPYLLAWTYDATTSQAGWHCLGIWDGETVLHAAAIIE